MSSHVSITLSDRIAVVTLDNPPVNALGTPIIEALGQAFADAASNASADAIVFRGAGKVFIAGADIHEFTSGNAIDMTPLLTQLENCPKPVVAAMHGTALGGGVEIAMACHYRIAAVDTQIGMPEVTLGIIPGAGGTQRLPRLVGMAKAAEMIISAQFLKATDAEAAGLVDKVVSGDLLEQAVAFASQIAAIRPMPRVRDKSVAMDEAGLDAARALAKKIRRNQTAPAMALDALASSATLPFDEGIAKERELAKQSLVSDQGKAMIHAFLAERAVSKIPGIGKETQPYTIKQAAIIGAGTMGGGITMAMINAGISVRLTDSTQEALDRGIATIRKNYENSVKKGRFTQEVVEARMALIDARLGYQGFETADIIVEAVFESMDLKKKIFGEIDAIAKRDCVLATNTSTLNIDHIASATKRPEMVIGLHFFSPANVMRLVEIVRGSATSPAVIATAMNLAKTVKKVGVLAGNCPGFIGNRMMFPYMREAQFLGEEGATPAQVDGALTSFGMAMGIYAVDDMGGLDVMERVKIELKEIFDVPGERKPLVHEILYKMGRLGQKTGSGWYKYDETRKPIPDPEVDALIESTAKAAGIARRAITNEEIVDRCVLVMVNEAAHILEEGHALRASDIDTIYLTGYGFPVYRGGPMCHADTVGLKKVVARIKEFGWTPAPLLTRLAAEGSTFAMYDAQKESH